MVLLKNSGNLLPLDKATLRSIALIGDDTAKTGGGGSSHVKPLYTVKPSDGLKSRAGSGVTVTVTGGSDTAAAAAAAKKADVAIVMVTDSESEGRDRPSRALSGNQDALVSAVAAANPKTVVVSKTGGPVLMPWVDQAPAMRTATPSRTCCSARSTRPGSCPSRSRAATLTCPRARRHSTRA